MRKKQRYSYTKHEHDTETVNLENIRSHLCGGNKGKYGKGPGSEFQ